MPRLTRSLAAFGTPGFGAVLKEELTALGPDGLGLQQELTAGSTALPENLGVMILRRTGIADSLRWAEHHRRIIVRFGRFPHRNEPLGREPTAEERTWLASREAFRG